MKFTDIIFALVLGRVIGFLVGDFLREWGIHIGFYWVMLIWLGLPLVSLFCLWIASIIGRKFLFLYQVAKFLLVGAAATVVDLKLFESFVALAFLIIPGGFIISKATSFLISTALKYWGNRHWVFNQADKEDRHKEAFIFLITTMVGLVIDVVVFYYLVKVLGAPSVVSSEIWLKISVIMAAFASSVWNFSGYKFFVFKK
jgi:putative flippase GtrA